MVSVAILAGGQSIRMGRDKSLLRLGDRLLIEWVIDRVKPLTDDLFINTNSPEKFSQFDLRCIPDIYPGRAALGGIYSALAAARYPRVLVLACDMPFLNTALLQYLVDLAPAAEAVVPVVDSGSPQMLHAIYGKGAVSAIEIRLHNNNLRIAAILEDISVRYVTRDEIMLFDPQFLSFFNLNTPDDWKTARGLIEAKK
jgi:molybdopterin-guanine dinucleotide biosynthesis protein A